MLVVNIERFLLTTYLITYNNNNGSDGILVEILRATDDSPKYVNYMSDCNVCNVSLVRVRQIRNAFFCIQTIISAEGDRKSLQLLMRPQIFDILRNTVDPSENQHGLKKLLYTLGVLRIKNF